MTEEICKKCVMDTTAEIKFTRKGICNYCLGHDYFDRAYPNDDRGETKLKQTIDRIKAEGQGKKYDCIIGVSGGTDSCYTLYILKKYGLRPLAVHFDNGWNTEISVSNIKKVIKKLNIDLFTYVVDWEEFKDIQKSFLYSSTPDVDQPTDQGIRGALFKVAAQEGIKYIMIGNNFRNEGKVPIFWSYSDGYYVKNVHNLFGEKSIKTYPLITPVELIKYNLMGIKLIKPLWYLNYNKKKVKPMLEKEFGWEYYGGHHYENVYTRFVHGYYLPKKFNIDKRKVELSAMCRTGQISRNKALRIISTKPYDNETIKNDIDYVIKKLGMSNDEFRKIMEAQPKSFADYKSLYFYVEKYKNIFSPFVTMSITELPMTFYYMDR